MNSLSTLFKWVSCFSISYLPSICHRFNVNTYAKLSSSLIVSRFRLCPLHLLRNSIFYDSIAEKCRFLPPVLPSTVVYNYVLFSFRLGFARINEFSRAFRQFIDRTMLLFYIGIKRDAKRKCPRINIVNANFKKHFVSWTMILRAQISKLMEERDGRKPGLEFTALISHWGSGPNTHRYIEIWREVLYYFVKELEENLKRVVQEEAFR